MLGRVALSFFQQSPMLAFPLVALALFMLVFFVITLRTVLTQKSQYDGIARLPLESGPKGSGEEVFRE